MAAPKLSERRVSQRYALSRENTSGHVIFEKSIALPLQDISYGGFSVAIDKPEHESLVDTLPRTSDVEIIMLGVGTVGRSIRVFESKQRLGYAFCHDTASVLIFLRRFIEFMRLGEHLSPVDKAVLKPPYDSSDWLCFRGDGPTDIVLRQSKTTKNTIEEAVIKYREKETYRTTELRNGKVFTHIHSDASSTQQMSSATQETSVNEDILRKSICLLLGYQQACAEAHQPLLNNLTSTIQKLLFSGNQNRQ
ncbi:MAG: hypothetical protein RJB13_1246 [Pseudomonadota bacterium]